MGSQSEMKSKEVLVMNCAFDRQVVCGPLIHMSSVSEPRQRGFVWPRWSFVVLSVLRWRADGDSFSQTREAEGSCPQDSPVMDTFLIVNIISNTLMVICYFVVCVAVICSLVRCLCMKREDSLADTTITSWYHEDDETESGPSQARRGSSETGKGDGEKEQAGVRNESKCSSVTSGSNRPVSQFCKEVT